MMQQTAAVGDGAVRRTQSGIGKRGTISLAAIGVIVLVSGILAPPVAAVPTPITVSAVALDFGDVAVGSSATMTVQVTNTSATPFGPINMFGGAPPTAEFGASQNCQGKTLAGGASCQVNYKFTPNAPGPFSDSSQFTISPTTSQADGEDFSITLTGRSGPPPPTITDFTPTAGAVDASVVITGTGFLGASSVKFNGVAATFMADSATQITAAVPAGASTGPIQVGGTGGTATSTTNFTVLPPAPTITGFTPNVGAVRSSVVISGTGLLGTSRVEFNGVPARFRTDSATRITAKVPAGARTGPITVKAPGGEATSTARFTVVVHHPRTITLRLRRHLLAKSRVSVGDDFARCESGDTVAIQRRRKGTWRTIDTDVTGPAGKSREFVPDRTGKYRAKIGKRVVRDGADVCGAAKSVVVRHRARPSGRGPHSRG